MKDSIRPYLKTEADMARIIDKHMKEAFDEINALHGTTPTEVTIDVMTFKKDSQADVHGIYRGCFVKVGD